MTLIIAGYTAAPVDKNDATTYYKQLATVKRAGGLELSWKEQNTALEIDDLLKIVPAHWVFTINAIPATAQAAAKDPAFGIASPNETGRQAAVALVGRLAASVREMNQKAGRRVVLAVEIQSAPGFNDRTFVAQPEALARSLREISAFNWLGTEVLLEHCDAYVLGQTPAKGFLTLDEELTVLTSLADMPIGISLNWGRSLLEVRDPALVGKHTIAARNSGLLRGYTLSGASGQDNTIGKAWADSHLPFNDLPNATYASPHSLMTLDDARQVLRDAGELTFLAVKTNYPASRKSPDERAASVIANFEAVVALLDETASHAETSSHTTIFHSKIQ
ncbi:DUF4862 family protein [Serratia sp. M24T3]|uniref:DUF4862 family protein n=1 Tax=Serratia sp. M24T3 TaxID=932213 RepID=UPI00025BB682|nr:DUF4862 family protein [Serratia sp. M24T3]EIC83095.1 UDP-N-acetylglucosamine pyrophosphorylase [Serratia sp. M24T3]